MKLHLASQPYQSFIHQIYNGKIEQKEGGCFFPRFCNVLDFPFLVTTTSKATQFPNLLIFKGYNPQR